MVYCVPLGKLYQLFCFSSVEVLALVSSVLSTQFDLLQFHLLILIVGFEVCSQTPSE